MYANDAFYNDFKATYRCGVVGVVVLPDMITSTIIFYGAWVVPVWYDHSSNNCDYDGSTSLPGRIIVVCCPVRDSAFGA